jgi:hypothetical protein
MTVDHIRDNSLYAVAKAAVIAEFVGEDPREAVRGVRQQQGKSALGQDAAPTQPPAPAPAVAKAIGEVLDTQETVLAEILRRRAAKLERSAGPVPGSMPGRLDAGPEESATKPDLAQP